MDEAALTWPQFRFDSHAGYGTAAHMRLLQQYGPCTIHRRTFAPLRGWLADNACPAALLVDDGSLREVVAEGRRQAEVAGGDEDTKVQACTSGEVEPASIGVAGAVGLAVGPATSAVLTSRVRATSVKGIEAGVDVSVEKVATRTRAGRGRPRKAAA